MKKDSAKIYKLEEKDFPVSLKILDIIKNIAQTKRKSNYFFFNHIRSLPSCHLPVGTITEWPKRENQYYSIFIYIVF